MNLDVTKEFPYFSQPNGKDINISCTKIMGRTEFLSKSLDTIYGV